eukprot:6982218-Heterocapsa_arctica.AAC.1
MRISTSASDGAMRSSKRKKATSNAFRIETWSVRVSTRGSPAERCSASSSRAFAERCTAASQASTTAAC